jgi:hypothetical protein
MKIAKKYKTMDAKPSGAVLTEARRDEDLEMEGN